MGIFSRLTDIVNSNINALLDKAEDPAKMIRLIIQEMEDTLVDVRSDAARLIADRKEVRRRLQRLADAQDEWQKRAELAVQKSREDLARAALVEKAKLAELIKTLAHDDETLKERMTHLDDDIARLQTKLAEAKAKQAGLMARAQTANARLSIREHIYDGRVDNAMARFDTMEKKLDEMEGRVEAFDVGRGTKTLADEIAELEAATQIEDELAKLKAGLGAGDGGDAGEKAKA
jgi:phage shock protein A